MARNLLREICYTGIMSLAFYSSEMFDVGSRHGVEFLSWVKLRTRKSFIGGRVRIFLGGASYPPLEGDSLVN